MWDWIMSSPLPPGTPAPEFELEDEQGNRVRLADLRGRSVVLVWYPADDTAICTKQLCEIRDDWSEFTRRNVAVYGVNAQGSGSHEKFVKKHQFPFPLLVDPGQKVGQQFHTHGLVVKRTVYVIGPDGRIRYGKRGKPPVAEILKHV